MQPPPNALPQLLSQIAAVERMHLLAAPNATTGSAIPAVLGCTIDKHFGQSDGMMPGSEITYLNRGCAIIDPPVSTFKNGNVPTVNITRGQLNGVVSTGLRFNFGYLAEGLDIEEVARSFDAPWKYLAPQLMSDGGGFSMSVQYQLPGSDDKLVGDVDPRTRKLTMLTLCHVDH